MSSNETSQNGRLSPPPRDWGGKGECTSHSAPTLTTITLNKDQMKEAMQWWLNQQVLRVGVQVVDIKIEFINEDGMNICGKVHLNLTPE